MFKKKGVGGFKPRAPIVRPRPQATASPARTASPAPTPAAEGPIPTLSAPASADGGQSPPDAPTVEKASPQPHAPVPGPNRDVDREREMAETQTESSTTHAAPEPSNEDGPQPPLPAPRAQCGAPVLTSEPCTTVQPPFPEQLSSSASVGSAEAPTTAPPPPPQSTSQTPILTPDASAQPVRNVTQAATRSPSPSPSAGHPLLPALQTASPPTQTPSSEQPSAASPVQTPDAPRHGTPASVPSSRRRKRLVASTEAGEPSGTATTTTQPRKRQKRAPAVVQDGEASQAPKQPRPRIRRASTTNEDAAGEDGEGVGGAVPRRRQQRSATPEDAEVQVVDLQTLKMSDLTRDLHIGKKFSRHDELKKREKQLKAQGKKKNEATSPPAGSLAGSEAPVTSAGANTPVPNPSSSANAGLQYQIIDGQIVIDQRSLALDRQARAEANREGDLEEIEENDFTRLITSNTFRTGSKLHGPNYWSTSDTELFYRGLRMFGTDFETIAKMFPGRTRRHVKMKFNREERKAGAQVTAALTGEKAVKMDIDEYKTWTGLSFEKVEDIMAEQDKRQAEYDAEAERVAMDKEEEMRKKREELFADSKEGDLAKKKRQKKTRQGLGEEVSVEDI